MISSICSVPIESLIVPLLIPTLASSSSESCECVVDAGWITKLLTSATLARRENISKLSINFHAASWPPLISNVKIEPPPLGKYFLYNSWSGWSSSEGWLTFSTSGWFFKNSTTFFVFSMCLSSLRESVSVPWRSKNALNGDIVAPVSRRSIARMYVTNATGPNTS